ncbi:hypothetical protein K435DRAFT_851298 [Dendrothele bispora CBS 962.96]|uniref:Uncharacterized protein n=1 Tax=Dendrothele bispora (strain CBS 962.96) TaxID=1314807 RepID=A0A4V4HHU8_DENBC|nr:hypothetical protein K435DRAFT_851298 [Dendrothele bispora CBS 962.96]
MERVWTPKFRSSNFDTRRFRLDRLGLLSGWKTPPTVISGLDFYLPQTNLYTGRVVKFTEEDLLDEETTKLELYSRNSKQFPFYPGLSTVPIFEIPYRRRVDGSVGRFDPTKNPQQFNKSRPYYPFILRSQTAVNTPRKPEDVPAFLVWESSSYPHEELGHLLPDYYSTLMDRIWRLQTQIRDITLNETSGSWLNFKSSQPPEPEAHNWGGEMTFDELVDNLAPLQRWVKELDAWIRMGKSLNDTPWNAQLRLSDTDTPEADESFIGVWANGMEEADLACAITTQRTSDPFLLTDWFDNQTCHEWNGLARRSRIRVDEDNWDPWVASSKIENKSALYSWKSSSLATTDNFPGQDTRARTEENSVPGKDKFGPKSPELRTLSDDRIPWMVPPRISNPPDKGSWEWFVEDMDNEDNRCLRYVGRMKRKELDLEDWPYIYYDRITKRKIHLCSEIITPRNLAHDINIFGLPGPSLCYYNDSEMMKRTSASYWVYKTEKPAPKDVGLDANAPDSDSLPKLHPEIISSDQEPSVPKEATLEHYRYFARSYQEEEEELDFGEPTPSPIPRPRELPLIRTPTPPAEEISPASPMRTTDDEKVESDPEMNFGGQKRKRRSSSEGPVAYPEELIEAWIPKLSKRAVPLRAPTCLLRLIGFNGSITDLINLLSKTCQKTAAEIRVARVNKVDTPDGTDS